MNTFVNAVNRVAPQSITARTQNGMRARSTTSNANVDLFGSIGAMRGKNIVPAFEKAFHENADLALRVAQWARDVRGGQGERQIYRDVLKWLEANQPRLLLESKLLDKLPELGRFDDLLIFTDGAIESKALDIFARALESDNGLAAKWAPRKGMHAVKLRNQLGMTPRDYRKFIVSRTNVVETQMCAREWNAIEFNHVPSVAMSRYMTAFHRNAPEKFQAYKDALKRNDGTAKVNAGAVYPYDIVHKMGGAQDLSYYGRGAYGRGFGSNPYRYDQVLQSMWDALPDYMNDANAIAICDNSGSMTSKIKDSSVSCLDVAASLTMYTAQKSKGAFRDLSVSFSDNASFVKHYGDLNERLFQVTSAQWAGSTNLHSAFNLILNHAVKNAVPAAEMPSILLIFSDMQFNHCARFDDSAMQMIRRKYEDAGYEMPAIVFWNLNDYGNKPVKFNDQGVALVSGFSPSTMKAILNADLDKFSPEAIMLQTVGGDRYSW